MNVLAPGKLFLTGAYAVLEGAPALVMAMGRYAVATDLVGKPRRAERPEVAAVQEFATNYFTQPCSSEFEVNTEDLETAGRKLGLGSSAAGAVAAAGYLFAAQGADLESPSVRSQIFELAFTGHHSAQPLGSGGDVAAATFGGVVKVARNPSKPSHTPAVEPHPLPIGLTFATFAAPRASRTSVLLEQLHTRRGNPAVTNAMDRLFAAAESGVSAQSVDAFLQAVTIHLEGLAMLGQALGATLIPEEVKTAAKYIRNAVLLPSGAGGGDMIVWIGHEKPSGAVIAELEVEGLEYLDIPLDTRGVHLADLLAPRRAGPQKRDCPEAI